MPEGQFIRIYSLHVSNTHTFYVVDVIRNRYNDQNEGNNTHTILIDNISFHFVDVQIGCFKRLHKMTTFALDHQHWDCTL